MPYAPPCSDEELQAAVQAVKTYGSQVAAAKALDMPRGTLQGRLRTAAARGFVPGKEISVAKVAVADGGADPADRRMNDPRKAETFEEACANGDGTYNGARAISWLSEVMNPGRGVPESEVLAAFEAAKAKRKAKQRP